MAAANNQSLFVVEEVITADVDSDGDEEYFSESDDEQNFYGFLSDGDTASIVSSSGSSESVFDSSTSSDDEITDQDLHDQHLPISPAFDDLHDQHLPISPAFDPGLPSTNSPVDFAIGDDLSPPAKKQKKKRKRKKKKKKKDIRYPAGYNVEDWVEGMCNLDPLPEFDEEPGFDFDLPEGHMDTGTPDVEQLFFYNLFVNDEVIQDMVNHTNLYYQQYLSANAGKIRKHARVKKFPVGGVTVERMKAFLALTFYMGLVRKRDIQTYWSVDVMANTPVVRTIMPRDEFLNIMTFFHLSDNATYPLRGTDGYNPRLKLGKLFTTLTHAFTNLYTPRQNLSIDEGCIPFKGHIHFRCFNKSKIEKYHIKSYKVCDSSNNYCLVFELYCGKEEEREKLTEFGVTHDLVVSLCQPYLGKAYIIHMDNWYTSPILVYNLKLVQTGACGTVKANRIGLPEGFSQLKLYERGDQNIFSLPGHMQLLKIYDRKVVALISSVYTCDYIPIGKKHWKTRVDITKPALMCGYNKYMGGVDANDQLLQYSAFSRQTLKWWKKVAFRLLNIAMVNAFILYKEYIEVKYPTRKRLPRQYNFRLAVIKQILASISPVEIRHVSAITPDFARLNGRHFPRKIPVPPGKKKVQRVCVVCTPAQRKINKHSGIEKKNPGRDTCYECKDCNVSLCVDVCFELYHTQKDYIQKYIALHSRI